MRTNNISSTPQNSCFFSFLADLCDFDIISENGHLDQDRAGTAPQNLYENETT